MCQKYQKKSALENCASTLRIRTARTAFNAAVRPRFLCQKTECCLEKCACYSPWKKCRKVQSVRTSISVLYGLCTALKFVQGTNCNKCSPLLVFCALLDLDFCALQTLLYGCLENRALLPFLLSQLTLLLLKNEKWIYLCLPHAFCLTPSGFLIQRWKKIQSNGWECKNPFYLNHLNKKYSPT